jgi:membrane protease YdiL (CAAX protease family)
MNPNEHEGLEPASANASAPNAGPAVTGGRVAVLGILIAALAFAEITKDVAFSALPSEWLSAWNMFYYALIACLPFLLARMAPAAADFDTQWLPRSRWHWGLFLGMIFLAFLSVGLLAALATAILGHAPPRPFTEPVIWLVTPTRIVQMGISMVLVGPIAEEIFFRGYVLEQLRKLTRSSIALLIHSLLFGLSHLYTWGMFAPIAVYNSIFTFFLAMILGGWRIKFRSLLPLVLIHILINATTIPFLKTQYDWAVIRSDRSDAKCPTISRETTYITEPLQKDGYPDYLAVLNRRSSKGVTSENNSAVLFWKALGPSEIIERDRAKYFQMLGIPPLPEKGDYFVDLQQYLARKNRAKPGDPNSESETADAWKLLDRVERAPWTKQQFPVLAAWLAANEKPLRLLVEASKRPRRYDPLICVATAPTNFALQPAFSPLHGPGFVGALLARAMLRPSAKIAESWEDLLTCHRMARLVGQGSTLCDFLMARSLEERACAGDEALLEHTPLTAAQIAKMREDLDRLPPMPKVADPLDVGERFGCLSTISYCSRQGRASLVELKCYTELEPMEAKEPSRVFEALARYSARTTMDWDLALRMGNSWYNRIAAAYRRPTWTAQKEALGKLNDDLHMLRTTARDVPSLDKAMLVDPRKAFSERVGQLILIMFLPSTALEYNLDATPAMTRDLTKLAFALAAYRADRGSYPARLAGLAPKYVREVPKDIFNDAELHYRREGKGYCLYSVGNNGKDDGGKGIVNGLRDDESMKKDWDDMVIRMPAAGTQ